MGAAPDDPGNSSESVAAARSPAKHGRVERYASIVIAVSALALSFSTTVIDLHRRSAEERHESGLELTDLVQRIVALPRQYAQALASSGSDPSAKAPVTVGFNNEKRALGNRAAEILNQYPSAATSQEYNVIADAVATDIDGRLALGGGNVKNSVSLLEESLNHTNDPHERAITLMNAGVLLFKNSEVVPGRVMFERSVKEAARNKGGEGASVPGIQLVWARWEASVGQCDEARKHLARSQGLDRRPESLTDTAVLVQRTEEALNACRPR